MKMLNYLTTVQHGLFALLYSAEYGLLGFEAFHAVPGLAWLRDFELSDLF